MDIAYLVFRKTFGTVSCNILIENLMKYVLGEQAHLASVFSAVSSDRTRFKRHKLKNKRFCLNIKHSLPREA